MLAFADDAALARLVIAAAQRRARLTPELSDARPRTVSGRLISLRAPTKHRRHYSMPQPRRRRHGTPARPPARPRIARRLPHGFSIGLMVELIDARADRAGGEPLNEMWRL